MFNKRAINVIIKIIALLVKKSSVDVGQNCKKNLLFQDTNTAYRRCMPNSPNYHLLTKVLDCTAW